MSPTGSIKRKIFQTGAEIVAYWRREHLIGTRPDITDSQAHARKIREQAERYRRSKSA